MVIKVLLVNLDPKNPAPPPNISLSKATLGREGTLHDYHVIVIDSDEVRDFKWYGDYKEDVVYSFQHQSETVLRRRYREQVATGGWIFCFAGEDAGLGIKFTRDGYSDTHYVNSYCWLPAEVGFTNEKGETTRITQEENSTYRELVKLVEENKATWTCYFSRLPPGSRTIATNRAGYPIFSEIPIGTGKLVLLPKFGDREYALRVLVERIIPRLVGEEVLVHRPAWLSEFKFSFEDSLKGKLGEIEMAKRLLFAKDRELKKAVAWAFQKLGLGVEEKPDGTLPDLEIKNGSLLAKVEVKGHDNDLGSRPDVLQVLGYISESEVAKGIVVCNHQASVHPAKRNLVAFTEAAIELARKNEIGLVSSYDLFNVVSGQIEGKVDAKMSEEAKSILFKSTGVVNLSQKLLPSP